MFGPGAAVADTRIKKIIPPLSYKLQIFFSQFGFLLCLSGFYRAEFF